MIDENRIKKNLELFSFPRLSGTTGEKKVLQLATQKVEELNLKPLTQDFVFSTFFGRTYPKIAFSLGFTILFLFYLNFVAFFISLLGMIIFVILGLLFILTRKPESIRLPKKLNSSNLYVNIDLKPNISESDINKHKLNGQQRSVLFLCHLDSKGQRFSILSRIRIIRSWVFSGLILFIIIIFKNYIFTPFSLLFYIIGFFPITVNFISTILFLLNTTNNESNGAIDNASGIACILELLTYFSNPESRLKHFNLLFIFTGAEECGTMGIRNFYYKIPHVNKDQSIILNFDAIAKNTYLFPGKKISDHIYTIFNMFLKNDKGLIIKRNPKKIYFGSHSDGYYLKKKNFHGIGFGDLESYEYIHSIHDTVDKVDSSLLKRLCETIIDNLIVFDNQI
ncbi:MAG: M28 family peptidase [Candidatus Lokiarchaeota archaeon]|nr:M28 family peptidase [Candidatus Lokiarchaeota archaeon]